MVRHVAGLGGGSARRRAATGRAGLAHRVARRAEEPSPRHHLGWPRRGMSSISKKTSQMSTVIRRVGPRRGQGRRTLRWHVVAGVFTAAADQ